MNKTVTSTEQKDLNWTAGRAFCSAAACSAAALTLVGLAAFAPPAPGADAEDWKSRAVSPVANPLFFEDPHIRTEIRPIFAYHRIGDDLVFHF